MVKNQLNLQEQSLRMEKMKADINNTNSETERNIPEMEHLKSEIALNMTKAAENAKKVIVGTDIQ